MAEKISDWRDHKVRARNAHLLENKLFSDVTFVVGESKREISAHKLILASASEVFEAMFYGNFATSDRIKVPGLSPEVFSVLMRHIYTDKNSALTEDNVLEVLCASKKYILPRLINECEKYLIGNLTAKNACLLYFAAKRFDEENLMLKCLETIDAQGDEALNSDHFSSLDHESVVSILSRDTLHCEELTAFKALEKWAVAQCIRNGLVRDSITAEEKRKVVGEAIYHIRFPTMRMDEFANGPARSDILTKNDRLDMFLYLAAEEKPAVPFKIEPRITGWTSLLSNRAISPSEVSNEIRFCHRFNDRTSDVLKWLSGDKPYCIRFNVDKSIRVRGFGLYRAKNDQITKQTISIKLVEDDGHHKVTLAKEIEAVRPDTNSDILGVYFVEDAVVHPFMTYIASVSTLNGQRISTYYGYSGKRTVTVDHILNPVTFSFGEDYIGPSRYGQLPRIYFNTIE